MPFFGYGKIQTAHATYLKDYDLTNYRNNQTQFISPGNECLVDQILVYTNDRNQDLIPNDPGWICTDASSQTETQTLDQAYDAGEVGLGRTITVDAGAVVLQGTGNVLEMGNGTDSDISLTFQTTTPRTFGWFTLLERFVVSDSMLITGLLEVDDTLTVGGTITGQNLDLLGGEMINSRIENLTAAPLCDNTSPGRLYHNTTNGYSYVCNGAQYVRIDDTGGAVSGYTALPAVQARRNTNFPMASVNVWYNIPFNLTDIQNNTDVLQHSTTNTERIDIKEEGLYRISYQINPYDNTVIRHRVNSRVVKNGNTQLSGSFLENHDYQDENVPTVSTFLAQLNAADFITLQVQRTTAATIINETMINIVKLEGIKGEKGDKGDKGDPGDGSSGTGEFSDGGESKGKNRTLGNTDNYSLGFLTNNQPRLHITNTGSVGIGNTAPYANKYLTLGNGGQSPIAAANGMYVDSPLGGGIYMGEADEGAQGKYEVWEGKMGVGTMTNHPLEWWTNNVIRMHINPSGQVGIGTTTIDTGLLLDVGGRIGATEYCNEDGTDCHTIADLVNTNAATLCNAGEYLDGNGNCYIVPSGGGGGTPVSYIFDAYDEGGNESISINATPLALDSVRMADGAYAFMNNTVTIQVPGLYKISGRISIRNDRNTGVQRSSILLQAEKNTGSGFVNIPGTICQDHIQREGTSNRTSASCSITFSQELNVGDQLRFVKEKTENTPMQTVPGGSALYIEFIR